MRDFSRRKLVRRTVSYGCFPRSRGNFAGRFARRKLFVWFVTSETSGVRHHARWNAKRFRITTPGVEIHFFSKQVPHHISEGGLRGKEKEGKRDERKWETERERESPHMKPLSAPIQQYFYIYYPLPLLSVTPLRPYPLIWNPQPNECTSAARLTSTAAAFPVHANILGTF